MTYFDSLLANGEEIRYRTKKHWIAPLLATITGSVLVLGGVVALLVRIFTDSDFVRNVLLIGGIVALVIGLVMWGNAFVHWWAQYYFVTNQKVLKVEGILRKSTSGSALEKINDITMEVPLLGRALGYGTLRVLTAADESNLTYTVMRDPAEFRKAILDQKLYFEQGDARAITDALLQANSPAKAAAAGATHDDLVDMIQRLAELRDSGAITAEDYEAKKTELLDRM